MKTSPGDVCLWQEMPAMAPRAWCPVVGKSQSNLAARAVVEALKKREVPVEYVLFADEGHGWRKQVNRVRSTLELASFFGAQLTGSQAK